MSVKRIPHEKIADQIVCKVYGFNPKFTGCQVQNHENGQVFTFTNGDNLIFKIMHPPEKEVSKYIHEKISEVFSDGINKPDFKKWLEITKFYASEYLMKNYKILQ